MLLTCEHIPQRATLALHEGRNVDDTSDLANLPTPGLQPAIVEHFGIDGLYGYRSISLTSKYAATVLIAKNGSGKTTLLGALDAFLRGHFSRLTGIEFSSIRCRLRGVEDMLTLSKADIDEMSTIKPNSELWVSAKTWEIEPPVLMDFLDNDYRNLDLRGLEDNSVFQTIFAKLGYSYPVFKANCDRLSATLQGRNANIDAIRSTLKSVLAGVEIVYLPTYRRIELSLPNRETRKGGRRISIQAQLGIPRSGLYAGDIQFGLSDISDRLAALHQEMLGQSNQGYGEISANIINDLITGAFERGQPSLEQRPSKDALNVFFSRIKEGREEGPYRRGLYNYIQIPDIEKIYSGEDISTESGKFLTYFLGKLNSVMQKTRTVEESVEEFIRNCNRYLSGEDESVALPNSKPSTEGAEDDKVLTFDRRNLRITVTSQSAKRKIPLDSLSSGEKQMISLFARLYLYPLKKIVLIDEPELSLSIDWQRKILPDILKSPSCSQIIAITHSPFVFDNELEPFATSLRLSFDAAAAPGLFSENDADDGAEFHE